VLNNSCIWQVDCRCVATKPLDSHIHTDISDVS